MGDFGELNLDEERGVSSDKKVMIVEDDDEIRHLLQAILEKEGFRHESAADGEAGLSKIRECKPDLIILDMMTA